MSNPITCEIDGCNCIETGALCYGVGRDQTPARNKVRSRAMTAPTPQQINELTAIIKSGGTATITLQNGEIKIVIVNDEGMSTGSDEEFYYALECALHELAHKE